jgi:hypothetical protein
MLDMFDLDMFHPTQSFKHGNLFNFFGQLEIAMFDFG